MYRLIFFISLIVSSSTYAQSQVGFKNGNHLQSIPVLANIQLFCQNGMSKFIRCSAELLDPSITDYFVGPENMEADSVELIAQWEDGSLHKKTSKYKNGKSKNRFNLWIQTLTQRPLLDLGQNRVQYNLSLKGQLVGQGEFAVMVDRMSLAQCPFQTVNSIFPDDCEQIDLVCNRHLQNQNYCLP
jgi:hypothetical protein